MVNIGEYTCPFYRNTGEVCRKGSMRPEGCNLYWKAKRWISCTDCNQFLVDILIILEDFMPYNIIIDCIKKINKWKMNIK